MSFPKEFKALTGHEPFPWQRALYRRFCAGNIPSALDLPTGLGKTSIIAIWLLSLAHHGRKRPNGFPLRMAYVVNRRTVVDQSTREAEVIRENLKKKPELAQVATTLRSLAARRSDIPLAISTLRGQFADNAEWRDDPARPAVVVGTVDMIGSRLVFGGYRCGFKSRPLHAGFLGQDTLLVHDEAHLEPAFQELIESISKEQRLGRTRDRLPMRIMALSATARCVGEPFGLSDADRRHNVVRRRIEAKKGIVFHPLDSGKTELPRKIVELAIKYRDSGSAVLVYARGVNDVRAIEKDLCRQKQNVQVLTGTMRGFERDELARDPIFARFLPPSSRPDATPADGTVYLVCTSAGEVGVNISADHLVCDLMPFDSMAQRFGRVNRFGDGHARIDIVHPSKDESFEEKDKLTPSRKATLSLLRQLPTEGEGKDKRRDASPKALSDLVNTLEPAEREAAFTPTPVILPATDILFDSWALTSVRTRLPGRPPPDAYLHGVAEWEPPVTHVAWREEVERITALLVDRYKPQDLLDDYPLKPHELLRERTECVFAALGEIHDRNPGVRAWLVLPDGEVHVISLRELVVGDGKMLRARLANCTVVLPPVAGGLSKGMLDGSAEPDSAERHDVADEWHDEQHRQRRIRLWDEEEPPAGMRLVFTIDTAEDQDEEEEDREESLRQRCWHWYERASGAESDGTKSAERAVLWEVHTADVSRHATDIAKALALPKDIGAALTLAAKLHDLGKKREVWQRSIGNRTPQKWLAKSGGKMKPAELSDYRHEFGSLLDAEGKSEFQQLRDRPELQDLVLHLIGAHHGRGRPHFPLEEAFDPERSGQSVSEMVRGVPARFARLQRRYGRWGLAYLESLLRAADYSASAKPSATVEDDA